VCNPVAVADMTHVAIAWSIRFVEL